MLLCSGKLLQADFRSQLRARSASEMRQRISVRAAACAEASPGVLFARKYSVGLKPQINTRVMNRVNASECCYAPRRRGRREVCWLLQKAA